MNLYNNDLVTTHIEPHMLYKALAQPADIMFNKF
jgi:hypothetical protein